MIIAGEASGDMHAAKLVTAAKRKNPDIHFYGVGADKMRSAGVEILADSKDMGVIGLVEIWAQRKVIFAALNQMRDLLETRRPDLLLLVDYPEFNLRLAKKAKKLGIKVLFYISPQIWAWRQYRVKKIRRLVDMMAVIFPFEVDFYTKHDVPVSFVGHPLTDEVSVSSDVKTLRDEFKLNPSSKVVGLFPGSRKSEVTRLFPIILQSAASLAEQQPDIQFITPIASTLDRSLLDEYLSEYKDLNIKVIENRTHDVISACDAIVTVSGTVTLEIALIGTPMVIINKVNWLTYAIVSRLLTIEHIGLCNIVAGKSIATELIQKDATPEKISTELLKIIQDENYAEKIRSDLATIEPMLGEGGGIDKIAELTVSMLEETEVSP